METRKFVRLPFEVEGVQVTEENMQEVAAWCGGEVFEKVAKGTIQPYVKVKVHRPLNEKHTQAFSGDWVLSSETGFKVYTDRALTSSFSEEGRSYNVFDQQEVVADGITLDTEAQESKPQPTQ